MLLVLAMSAPSLPASHSYFKLTASVLMVILLALHTLQLMSSGGRAKLPDARSDRDLENFGEALATAAQQVERERASSSSSSVSGTAQIKSTPTLTPTPAKRAKRGGGDRGRVESELPADLLENFRGKFRKTGGGGDLNSSTFSLFIDADKNVAERACTCHPPKKLSDREFLKGGGEPKLSKASWSCSVRKARGRTHSNLQTYWAAKTGDDGMMYMHMPFLARLPNRSLAMAFQASAHHEGAKDQHLRIAISSDDHGANWYPSFEVPTLRVGAQWGPVLHYDARKSLLWLFYTESKSCLRPAAVSAGGNRLREKWLPGGDIFATHVSLGNPKVPFKPDSFAPPRMLYSETADGGIPKVLAGKLVVLRNGDWILPFWREKHTILGVCESDQEGSAGVLVSQDRGESWRPYGRIIHPGTWLIEGALAQMAKSDHLIMVFRTSAGTGELYFSKSDDNGRTWSQPASTKLANPGAKLVLTSVADNAHALVFNNHKRLPYPLQHSRTDLDLIASSDDGRSWGIVHRLESSRQEGRMFHYPSLLEVTPCKLVVAYTASSMAMMTGEERAQTDFNTYGIHIAVVNADKF